MVNGSRPGFVGYLFILSRRSVFFGFECLMGIVLVSRYGG
jgi:hypothetical protein